MSKIVLDNISGGHNLQKINDNFDKIEAEFNNKVVYRDEAGSLSVDLDANGKQIYNLPAPTSLNSAARQQDVLDAVAGAKTAALTSFTPVSDIVATNVQGAIEEINTFTQAGTGAVNRTLQSKDRDFVDFSDFGGIPASADCSSALVNAIATGKIVQISTPGTYKFLSNYNGTTNFNLEATCDGVIFDYSGAGATYSIKNSGSLTALPALSLAISAGRSIATFASTPSLSVGDWFCVYNATDYSYSGWRTYYRAGEWKQVASILGNVVTTTQPFADSYVAANMTCYKMNSVVSRIKGVSFIGGATTAGCVWFALSDKPIVENVNFKLTSTDSSCITFDKTVRAEARNVTGITNGSAGGTDYGIVCGNSQHMRIYGGDVYASRHAVTIGGDAGVCCVPNRDFRCYNMILRSNPEDNVGAADMHGNAENCQYINCTIYGVANISGGDGNWYKDCDIYASGGETAVATGWVAYYREVKGGTGGFTGCNFYSWRDPQPNTHTLIDIGINSSSAITALTTVATNIVVKNCRMYGRNMSSSTSFVGFKNQGTTVAVNFDIQEITFDINLLGQVLYTASGSGTPLSKNIIVDGITGCPTGTLLHNANGSSYLNFPHRLQKQAGKSSSTTIVNNQITTSPITYPYAYPRSPVASCQVTGSDNATLTTLGGQIPTPIVYQSATTSIRLGVLTSANMTAGTTFDFHWKTELSEC